MSEISAFLAGLILGDSGGAAPHHSNSYPKKRTNIALQDTIFCQCLANIIAELEEFIKTKNPSPADFIKHLIPETNFDLPYTDKEIEIIKNNEDIISRYEWWINYLISNNQLIDDYGNVVSTYEELSALRRIWQDSTHTPDINNLDLLFSIEFSQKLNSTVKKNGVIYEYANNEYPRGIAKGFFQTIPAKLIFLTCVKYTSDILGKFGFQYDSSRFEYNKRADKQGSIKQWKYEQRMKSYDKLVSRYPEFCKITWSNLTKEFKLIRSHATSNKKLKLKDKRFRLKEVYSIIRTLNEEETKKYSTIDFDVASGKLSTGNIINILFACALIVSSIVLLIWGVVNDAYFDRIVGTWKLGDIIILIMVSIWTLFLCINYIKHFLFDNVTKYILFIQNEYYLNNNNEQANEYKELLSRINK